MFWLQHMMGLGWGSWIAGGLMMFLFWGAIIALIILALRVFSSSKDRVAHRGNGGGEDPLDILKLRYARGEISKEEYDTIRNDLKG